MMRWRWATRIAICLATVCGSTAAAAAGNQSWFVAESGSIRVITDNSPAVAEQVLDGMLAAESMLKQAASVEPLLPVKVFAVKDARSLSDLAPRQFKRGDIHTFGFSHTGPHAAFIAIRTDRPGDVMLATLRHEYGHVLTAAQSPEAPAWLDEGLSEFWGAMAIEGDRIVVGRPIAEHLAQLQRRKWLSLQTILKQRRGSLPSNLDQVPQFYAQAWAMVHYLLLGQDDASRPAFMPTATDLPPQFEETVRHYMTGGRLREVSTVWQPPASAPRSSSTISEARALAERADLLVSGPQPRAALPVARRALALDPAEPLALEVVGTAHFLNNEPAAAREWLGRALGTGVRSYRAALYMSLLSSSPADRERYLSLAVLSRPDSSVAWQRLGEIYNGDGRLAAARRWCRDWSRQPPSWLWMGHLLPCGS